MTTTVTVQAHCSKDKEVVIKWEDMIHSTTDPYIKTIKYLQDGESTSEIVYDNISLKIYERTKPVKGSK